VFADIGQTPSFTAFPIKVEGVLHLYGERSEWKKAVVFAVMEALERAGPLGAVLLKTRSGKAVMIAETAVWNGVHGSSES
jgi:hypothetical protein